MPKFRPFTDYLLRELDRLIDGHGLRGPFLDGGCGPGYVAAHCSRRGWSGVAIDNSPTALQRAREYLDGVAGVEIVDGSIEDYEGGPFETATLFDVLEHVEDDRGLLRAVARLQRPGGMLVLTVPTHEAREWRWDDDLWGHLRRYDAERLETLLEDAGYRPLEMWDVTFPFFWALRRAYTRIRPSPPIEGSPRERTIRGHQIDPWDFGRLYGLVSWTPLWRPIFAVQHRWRHRVDAGHEMMVLARREPTGRGFDARRPG